MENSKQYLILIFLVLRVFHSVHSHGYFYEPPSRVSAWRHKELKGFPTDTNDMGWNCGGINFQWNQQNGKCGYCGDPYGGPYEVEAGGKYDTGKIVREYKEGQIIDVTVVITAAHKGWYEFRLCIPKERFKKIECNREELLKVAAVEEGSVPKFDETRIFKLPDKPGKGFMKAKLPDGFTCDNCVLQWKWHAGNNWGYENGVGGMGLGSQEEFYGCADIKITPGDGSQGPTTKPLGATTSKKTTTTVAPKSTTTAVYVPWWRTTRTTQPITTTRPTTTQPTTTTRRTTTKASAYPMGSHCDPENGYGYFSKESQRDVYLLCGKEFKCSPIVMTEPDCRGKNGQYIKDSRQESVFYRCVHNIPYKFECSPGLVWCQRPGAWWGRCNWRRNCLYI